MHYNLGSCADDGTATQRRSCRWSCVLIKEAHGVTGGASPRVGLPWTATASVSSPRRKRSEKWTGRFDRLW